MDKISPLAIIVLLGLYFLVLIIIARLTSKGADNDSFFIGNRKSPWYIVAFGMIGASLSGVTFISVPGWVGDRQFSYMQMVLGYILGYVVIAFVLMPMYYRLKLTSIYTYLDQRFGSNAYKTGSAYFLLSRTIGASFRLYLIAIVLQKFVMDAYGIPYALTVAITIFLIWIYTNKAGIKTIIWTDTLQTVVMLTAVTATVIFIINSLDLNFGEAIQLMKEENYAKVWFFSGGWSDARNFFKLFFAGMFITIVMTGLDQDMMQKNLSCRTLADAQKNMLTLSLVLVVVNLIFLMLGALLYIYADQVGMELPTRMVGGASRPDSDLLYPTIAIEHLPIVFGLMFVIGLIASAYSSADSALTALTTSVCVDFLNFEKSKKSEREKQKLRRIVHLLVSLVLFFVIQISWWINNDAVNDTLFTVSGYTYGPLLVLYTFGFFVKRQVNERYLVAVCIMSPVVCYFINKYSDVILYGYKFGFELLLLNGLITFLGLYLFSKKANIPLHLIGRRL